MLEELVKGFGVENVLTDHEDLYVYSFYGAFGARRRPEPMAVLKLADARDARLAKLADVYRVCVVGGDGAEKELRYEEPDAPTLVVDCRETISAEAMREALSELGLKKEEGHGLRKTTPLLPWLVSSLKARDAYRITAQPDSDDGFCTVQRFFGGVKTYSAKGRLLLTKGLLNGELDATGKLVDSIYNCTACGQCYGQLGLTGLEINNAIVKARCEIVKKGRGPMECRAPSNSIVSEGNPLGMPAEDRILWFEELADEFPFRGNDVLYWSGCSTAYRLPSIVESTANLLKGAEIDFGMLGTDERCCGLILYLLGLWEEAKKNALEIVEKMRDLNVRLLVTNCAGCYYAFKRVYPILDVYPRFEVRHASQFIESLILGGRLQLKALNGRYVWHDPCDLGRHCGVFEPPRNVLRAIPRLDLLELPLNREHALCCGAGGGLWMYNAKLTESVALSKVEEEIVPLDVDGVVTGCPSCILNLKYATKQLEKEMPIHDITELVDKCI